MSEETGSRRVQKDRPCLKTHQYSLGVQKFGKGWGGQYARCGKGDGRV